jgi:hypothetical protein
MERERSNEKKTKKKLKGNFNVFLMFILAKERERKFHDET